MSRIEKFICDLCGDPRTGIIEIPPRYGRAKRAVDVCEDCTNAFAHMVIDRRWQREVKALGEAIQREAQASINAALAGGDPDKEATQS